MYSIRTSAHATTLQNACRPVSNAEMPALDLRYLAAIILIDGRLGLVEAQDRERFNNDARAQDVIDAAMNIENWTTPRTCSHDCIVSMGGSIVGIRDFVATSPGNAGGFSGSCSM